MNTKRMIHTVILTLLLSTNVISAKTIRNPKLHIGLFKTVKTGELNVQPLTDKTVILKSPDGNSYQIQKNKTLRINIVTEGLEFSIEGKPEVLTRTLTLENPPDGIIRLEIPDSPPLLATGSLRVSNKNGNLDIILSENLETILDQILVSELDELTHPRAMIALSIVIRTYLYFHIGRHNNEHFDFCDTTHCQVFKGWNSKTLAQCLKKRTEVQKLISGTRHVVMTSDGKLIEGFYTACCGGWTATPQMIWGGKTVYNYRQTNSPFCAKSPYYRWTRKIERKKFADLFKMNPETLKVETPDPSPKGGYVKEIVISDGSNSKKMSVTEFRTIVGKNIGWNRVLSHSFTASPEKTEIVFNGKGFGHGIGFCVHSALEMDRLGYHWKNIIDFFYQLVTLIKLKA